MFRPDDEPVLMVNFSETNHNFINKLKGDKESPKVDAMKQVEQLLENNVSEPLATTTTETIQTEYKEQTETPMPLTSSTEIEPNNDDYSFRSEWVVWAVLALIIISFITAFVRFRSRNN